MGDLISVIVPVYRVEEYLDKCVQSIADQTYRNLEIILVDDGSPDSCPQKCDEWAEKDSRIVVIHKENQGAGMARNAGLDIARGEYVSFVDSDDYLSSDAIEVMHKKMEADHSDLVFAQFVKVSQEGKINPSSYTWFRDLVMNRDEVFRLLESRKYPLPVSLYGKLYRRHIFDNLRLVSLRVSEDLYIFPHVLDQCTRISFMERTVYYYVQRDVSLVHTKTYNDLLCDMFALLHVTRFLYDLGYSAAARRYYHSVGLLLLKLGKDPQGNKMVETTFNAAERRKLRKGKDLKMIVSYLCCRFSSVDTIYKWLKRKKIK